MANPLLTFSQGPPRDMPYHTLSTNYGLSYNCRDLYNRIINAASLEHVLGSHYDGFSLQKEGPEDSPIDPYVPILLTALSGHKGVETIFLTDVNWRSFPSRQAWHASITAFPNVTYLILTSISLLAEELCSFIRSAPLLQNLEIHMCTITNDFPSQTLSAIPARTVMANQQGPQILSLDITVGEDCDTIVDFFNQPWSPLSFLYFGDLKISGKGMAGGKDIAKEIARLVDISVPSKLDVNCANFYCFADAPSISIGWTEVRQLEIVLPLDGANDFQRTSDCLQWWTSSLKLVPRNNKIVDIVIHVEAELESITYLPSGMSMIPWIAFDEALSDGKFKLNGAFSVAMGTWCTSRPFDGEVYERWLESNALPKSFERHTGVCYRQRG
ncbi:uncharacterized protein EV420DRAFT_1641470 [Desarmillaria tabescens]|uniref:Uncharacterized protein n=1 Tax=Armillaria tabescens TaxID=1929756 RepID=A0AA39KHG9_ARMTA|nr:uncharacterized protein EV420DRAFT_1641470 [Desarmillaria tabescens]KAK0460140.1 hypothetical protein EV420DRAFT_1641470 [Desarmillaria tabescens]